MSDGTNRSMWTGNAAMPVEREGAFDWETLADADAEYREWLEACLADDLRALEAANDDAFADDGAIDAA